MRSAGGDFQVVHHRVDLGDLFRHRDDGGPFALRCHRTAQGDHAVLGDDLHVLGIDRQALVGHHRLAHRLGDGDVLVAGTLVEGRGAGSAVVGVAAGVVRRRRTGGAGGRRGGGGLRRQRSSGGGGLGRRRVLAGVVTTAREGDGGGDGDGGEGGTHGGSPVFRFSARDRCARRHSCRP